MRFASDASAVLVPLLGLALLGGMPEHAQAQDFWDLFRPPRPSGEVRPSPNKQAMPGPGAGGGAGSYSTTPPWLEPRSRPVERADLAPAIADGSGLPVELWRGVEIKNLEAALAEIDIPPRSPALHALWRRMLRSSALPPAGTNDSHFLALRLEALYRSGLLDDMGEILDASSATAPEIQALRARRDVGLGRREAGCRAAKALAALNTGQREHLKGEAQLFAGYCAAVSGDAAGAGLAAALAREEGLEAELPLAVLNGVASGTKPKLHLEKRALLIDYRFLELLGPINAAQLLERAEPALLAVLARDGAGDAGMQIVAAEAAFRLNIVSASVVLAAYAREQRGPSSEAASRRANLFNTLEGTESADLRARAMRSLLEHTGGEGQRTETARLLAPALLKLPPSPELGWFATPAVEIALSGGEFATARRWAQTRFPGHWLALVAIADAEGGAPLKEALGAIDDLARGGQINVDALQRLVTVLDALNIEMPMTLWDAASRAPQPAYGYLPETGLLADLAQSSKRKELGRTVLLVMRALGRNGPAGAHVLALRDAIAALKRVGLEADARRLGVEALLPMWPRAVAN
jgi:hypothetical protein